MSKKSGHLSMHYSENGVLQSIIMSVGPWATLPYVRKRQTDLNRARMGSGGAHPRPADTNVAPAKGSLS